MLASKVDYLVASERFACQMAELADLEAPHDQEHALATLAAWRGGRVAITLGERGVIHGKCKATLKRLPAFTVPVVDTTGAGDLFHGAFVYALLRRASWAEALRLGSAAAAVSVTKAGGSTSIPDQAAVDALMGTL